MRRAYKTAGRVCGAGGGTRIGALSNFLARWFNSASSYIDDGGTTYLKSSIGDERLKPVNQSCVKGDGVAYFEFSNLPAYDAITVVEDGVEVSILLTSEQWTPTSGKYYNSIVFKNAGNEVAVFYLNDYPSDLDLSNDPFFDDSLQSGASCTLKSGTFGAGGNINNTEGLSKNTQHGFSEAGFLDSSTSRIILSGSNILGINEFSFCGWVYFTQHLVSYAQLFSNSKAELIVDSANNRLAFHPDGGGLDAVSSSSALALNKWLFIGFSVNSSRQVNFYVGDLLNEPALSGSANQSVGAMQTGIAPTVFGSDPSYTKPINGALHGIKVYSDELTLQQFIDVYDGTIDESELTKLVDIPSSYNLEDLTGNNTVIKTDLKLKYIPSDSTFNKDITGIDLTNPRVNSGIGYNNSEQLYQAYPSANMLAYDNFNIWFETDDTPKYVDVGVLSTGDNGNIVITKSGDAVTELIVKKKMIKPIITILDDDGNSKVLTDLAPLLKSKNISPGLALIGTSEIINDSEKRSQVVDLQNNYGWEILSHTMSHTDLDTLTEAEAEAEFQTFLSTFGAYGFNVKNFVYPHGIIAHESILLNYFNSAFTTTPGANVYGNITKSRIKRIGLDSADMNPLSYYQGIIDTAVTENQWLVFMTHSGYGTIDFDFIESVIDYALAQGCEFKTPQQAFNVFVPDNI